MHRVQFLMLNHKQMTKKAVEESELENYLKADLEISDGYKKKFKGKFIKYSPIFVPKEVEQVYSANEWLQQGSHDEDLPMCQSYNHFHDPLKAWSESFISGPQGWISDNIFMKNCGTTWKSAITWASSHSPYNWSIARNDALTLPAKSDREFSFSDTFQSVGHAMHLLQDMAVPAHVRNDFYAHVRYNYYTEKTSLSREVTDHYEFYVIDHSDVITSKEPTYPLFFPGPDVLVTDFWDKNIYTGTNPSYDVSQGLSEITNANFLSQGSIYENDPPSHRRYPNPRLGVQFNICEEEITCEDPFIAGGKLTLKIRRLSMNGCSPPSVAISLKNEQGDINDSNTANLKIYLDKSAHAAYADILCPLAVGYSTRLLDYFFRAKIDLVPDEETNSGFVILNKSVDDMDGTFELYYDNINDVRIRLWSRNLAIDAGDKSKNINDIESPTDAKVAGKYILVFRGKLGKEDVGVGGKVINVPFVVVNICGYYTVWDTFFQEVAKINDPVTLSPVDIPCYYSSQGFRNWLKQLTEIPTEQCYTWNLQDGSCIEKYNPGWKYDPQVECPINSATYHTTRGHKLGNMLVAKWVMI